MVWHLAAASNRSIVRISINYIQTHTYSLIYLQTLTLTIITHNSIRYLRNAFFMLAMTCAVFPKERLYAAALQKVKEENV